MILIHSNSISKQRTTGKWTCWIYSYYTYLLITIYIIFNNLKSLSRDKGIGMLIIEHNMEFILRRGVDHIIVMDNGTVLAEGTPDEIRQRNDVVEAYLGTGARN